MITCIRNLIRSKHFLNIKRYIYSKNILNCLHSNLINEHLLWIFIISVSYIRISNQTCCISIYISRTREINVISYNDISFKKLTAEFFSTLISQHGWSSFSYSKFCITYYSSQWHCITSIIESCFAQIKDWVNAVFMPRQFIIFSKVHLNVHAAMMR